MTKNPRFQGSSIRFDNGSTQHDLAHQGSAAHNPTDIPETGSHYHWSVILFIVLLIITAGLVGYALGTTWVSA